MILKKSLISKPHNSEIMNSTLKSAPADSKQNETSCLKVIKSEIHKKIHINTLMPDFSYNNSSGESMKPKNCVLL